MRKNVKRVVGLMLAALLILPLVSCSNKPDTPLITGEKVHFPLEDEITLTYWITNDSANMGNYETLADHPIFKRMKEKTNVNIEFIHPNAYNDMIEQGKEWDAAVAAGNMPDIFTPLFFHPYAQGTDKSIADNIFIRLNELIDTQMTNLGGMMRDNALISKAITTAEGNIAFIPSIQGENAEGFSGVTSGLIVRKDFMDELQIDEPVTLDDWYEMLRKFQVSLNIERPLAAGELTFGPVMGNGVFLTAYGQREEFYIGPDKKVHYGAIEQGMLDYLTLIQRWRSEGLFVQGKIEETLLSGNDVGAWFGSYTDIDKHKRLAADANFEAVGVPYPVLKAGDKITLRDEALPISGSQMGSVYITAQNMYPEISLAYLDQFFTKEMYMESSYGMEGEDYTMVDGKPVLTEKITKDPDGVRIGLNKVAAGWSAPLWSAPSVDLEYSSENVKSAVFDKWTNASNENNLPPGQNLFYTQDEQAGVDNYGTPVWMCYMNNANEFVGGTKPLSEWDNYVDEMQALGVNEYVAVKDSAYQRYLTN